MLSKARRRSLPTLRQSRPSVFVRYSVIIYSKMLWRATIRTAWPRMCWNSRCKRRRRGFLPKPVDSATVRSACSKEVVFQLLNTARPSTAPSKCGYIDVSPPAPESPALLCCNTLTAGRNRNRSNWRKPAVTAAEDQSLSLSGIDDIEEPTVAGQGGVDRGTTRIRRHCVEQA